MRISRVNGRVVSKGKMRARTCWRADVVDKEEGAGEGKKERVREGG